MQLQVSLKNPDVISQETKDIALERLERYRNGETETLSLETYQKNLKQKDLQSMPIKDKMQMIEQLWDSMNDSDIGLTEQQKQELDLRLEKIKDGTAAYLSWEEAKARIQS